MPITPTEYYEATENEPPNKLLTEAINFVEHKGHALDLGAGALRDSVYLLNMGFSQVHAVEQNPLVIKYKTKIQDPRLLVFPRMFTEFDFIANNYDLVSAQWSLPFEKPDNFDMLISQISASLKSKGVFTGQFFGPNDSWNNGKFNMTFKTVEDTKRLLTDLEILKIHENEHNGKTATGVTKHWHVIEFIAKKS